MYLKKIGPDLYVCILRHPDTEELQCIGIFHLTKEQVSGAWDGYGITDNREAV